MQTQGSDLNLDSYVDVTQENIKTQRVIRLKKRNNKSVIQEKNLLSSRNQSEIIDSNTENNAYGNAIVTEPQACNNVDLSKPNLLYSKATIRNREKYLMSQALQHDSLEG